MATNRNAWWRGAVIYQIYPRSFRDSNGDGLGDLPGILSKLDYVASLGVDAIWLSPIFPSPQVDFGYDVSDYCNIEPAYGTLADFDRLLNEAHERGLKIVLDQVLSHTSIEHSWFLESRSSRSNAKADWYVWADPRNDGTVPNNWLAAFGGAAWSYWPERRQYYHHKFYREQPKLNLHNEDCAAAVLRSVEFWLARGVDGFRLDVANSYLHDATLANNPPIPAEARGAFEWGHPPRMQRHLHDANRPDNPKFLEAIRAIIDRFPERFVFGEISEEPERIAHYVTPKCLHSVYAFDFLESPRASARSIREAYERWEKWAGFFPCIAFSNHDFLRVATRWQNGQPLERRNDALAKLYLTLLMTLKGTALLYQGEELGLPEADIALDRIRDPVGRLYYPLAKGRDGCRTPMPWQTGASNAGFSEGAPWLPIPHVHRDLAADRQNQDPDSVLHFARGLLRLRAEQPALQCGEITFIGDHEQLLVFERTLAGRRIRCEFNFGESAIQATAPANSSVVLALNATDQSSGILSPFSARVSLLS